MLSRVKIINHTHTHMDGTLEIKPNKYREEMNAHKADLVSYRHMSY